MTVDIYNKNKANYDIISIELKNGGETMGGFIVMIICIFIALGFFIGLLFLPAVVTFIKMGYYEKVEGTIVDKDVKRIDTTEASGIFVHYKYEFNYLNKTYKIEDKGYGYNKKLEIGNTVDIYIKKGNPEKYIYPNRIRDRYKFLILSLAGILPLLFLLKLILFDL